MVFQTDLACSKSLSVLCKVVRVVPHIYSRMGKQLSKHIDLRHLELCLQVPCCIYQVWLQQLLSHQFAWLLSLPDHQNLKFKEILSSETGCLDWLKTNAWPKACHWKPRTKASQLDGTINGPACDCTNVCKPRTKYIYIYYIYTHIYIVCTKACDPKKHTIMYSRINILQWFGLP